MPHDIFVSYSRLDLSIVRPIKENLESCGFSCWMDIEGIESGSDEFTEKIAEAIGGSTIVLFFLSTASQSSRWSLNELRLARRKGKRLVLVRINDDDMQDKFMLEFAGSDIIDWRRPEQKEKLFRNLRDWTGVRPSPRSEEPSSVLPRRFPWFAVLSLLFSVGLVCSAWLAWGRPSRHSLSPEGVAPEDLQTAIDGRAGSIGSEDSDPSLRAAASPPGVLLPRSTPSDSSTVLRPAPELGRGLGLAEATDWRTDALLPWTLLPELGGAVAQSSFEDGVETSRMVFRIEGPGRLSFSYWKDFYRGRFFVSCDEDALYGDTSRLHGSRDWFDAAIDVPAGAHEIAFCYTHGGVGYADAFSGVRIRNLRFEVSSVLYVDAGTGDDANDGGSWAASKKSIQSAIDSVASGGTIFVADGVYAPISTGTKRILVRSVNGALATVVDAKGSSLPAADCGSNTTNAVLQGFTFRNGNGVGVSGGILRNCIVHGFKSGSGVEHAVAESCLIYDNHAINGAGAIGSLVRNCTIVGNSARDSGGGTYCCAVYNSIVCGNTVNGRRLSGSNDIFQTDWPEKGILAAIGQTTVSCCTSAPGFVDADGGDYHLLAGSPCIDAGDNAHVGLSRTDLDGKPRIGNRVVDIGCYESSSVPGVANPRR